MIELNSVSKVYPNNHTALSNISMSISKGEFVFIVGPSGAGKSTIVKLLMKETDMTSGEINVNNIDIDKLRRKQVPYYRRNIGVVFQDFRLLQDKTVYENIAFAMRIVGASTREIKKRVPQIMSLVGLNGKASQLPSQLSGGEQQRVALARAIINNPPILICDEPTGNLDAKTAWGIMQLLDDINKGGMTILMVTHDKEVVNRMKKRVIAIEKGAIVRDEKRGAYGYES